MSSQPIPPIQPGNTQPTGKITARSLEVRQLRDDLRSPQLPALPENTVTVQPRNGLGQKVRGWGS